MAEKLVERDGEVVFNAVSKLPLSVEAVSIMAHYFAGQRRWEGSATYTECTPDPTLRRDRLGLEEEGIDRIGLDLLLGCFVVGVFVLVILSARDLVCLCVLQWFEEELTTQTRGVVDDIVPVLVAI